MAKAFSSQSRSRLSGELTRIEAPHAKAQVLRIAKPRLNSPAFSIGRHQLFGGIRCRACGQTPGFFHILGVDTDNGAYLIAISRNKSVAQGSRTSAHSN